MSDLQEAAQIACAEIGVTYRPVPADGRFHQLDVECKPNRNGAGRIRLFPDSEGGSVWNFVSDETRLFWVKNDRTLSPADQFERKQRIMAEREQSDKEIAAARQRAAETSRKVLKESLSLERNAYLNRKGVTPTETLREIQLITLTELIGYTPRAKGRPFTGEHILIVPVSNHLGVTTIEMIDETGLKSGLVDGQKKDCFWSTGQLPDGDGTGQTIGIGEGVATMLTYHMATGDTGIAALSCGNLKAVALYFRGRFPNAKIVIVSDIGNGEQAATDAAHSTNSFIAKPLFPEGSKGSDINDLHVECGLDAVKSCLDTAFTMASTHDKVPTQPTDYAFRGSFDKTEPDKIKPRLKAVTIEELLQNKFPERESMLHPIIQTQSLNMVHAWRGCGKTHFGLGIAYAIASGGRFLKWKAETPRSVLYIDGEMPGNSLQDRLSAIVAANNENPPPGFFQVLTPDLQEPGAMPDLSTPDGQAAIDALITEETALIVVDNLSCLCRGGKENDSESWIPVQGWALRHRAAGRSILFVHHSGKGGEQRGTSKREDVLDLVLKLKRPTDYEPSQGARFEVIFEKARHLAGDETTSFEATLSKDEADKQLWVFKDVSETTYERVIELMKVGLSQNEIANELEINKSNVSRHVRKARTEGKLPPAGHM